MSTGRKSRVLLATAVTTAVVCAHLWTLWSHSLSGSLEIVSFALVCLSLSWTLATFKKAAASAAGQPAVDAPVKVHTTISVRGTDHRLKILPSKERVVNAFTIDLEDYFHTEVATQAIPPHQWESMPSRIRASVPKLLDLLDAHGVKSTVFVLGWVARRYPSLIREVAERGHEIACHSHHHRAVFRLDAETFREDTRIAKQAIEDACGQMVSGYRAPSFSITPGTEWAFDSLAELGFQYDSSVNPVRHKFYGNPNAPRHPYYVAQGRMLEIPIATWRVCGTNLPIGGGAYLRLLPGRFINYGLNRLNHKELRAGTLYVHPWEIDSLQPPMKLNWLANGRQTWGVTTMEEKLGSLFTSFRFAPIQQVYAGALMPVQASLSYESTPAPRAYAEVV